MLGRLRSQTMNRKGSIALQNEVVLSLGISFAKNPNVLIPFRGEQGLGLKANAVSIQRRRSWGTLGL